MPFASISLPNATLPDSPLLPGLTFGTGSDWRANPRPVDDDNVSQEVVEAIKDAVKAGFRSFDTAENYKNERSLGVAIKSLISSNTVTRDEIFVTSKVHPSIGDVPRCLKQQLEWLGIDSLDAFLIHTPKAVGLVSGLTLAAAWKELEALVEQGFTKTIGVSNYYIEDFEQFIDEAKIKPVLNQISVYPYILHKVQPTIDYCHSHGIVVEVYEVLSSLIRPSEKGGPLDEVLEMISTSFEDPKPSHGQVLLQWAASKNLVPVTTSSKLERMIEYVKSGDFTLTKTQVDAIDRAGLLGAELGFGKYSSWRKS